MCASGTKLVEYQYDAWSKVTVASGSNANLAAKNPFRYRGYYYDSETGFYYLQSRYYDPQTGRFLNADAYADTGDTVLSTNMFAYCENNPVNGVDPSGEYDGDKAVAYARRWWNGTNSMYKTNSYDCANFVSQCLYAGKLSKMTREWCNHGITTPKKNYTVGKISNAWVF